jgi:hypothetical protein
MNGERFLLITKNGVLMSPLLVRDSRLLFSFHPHLFSSLGSGMSGLSVAALVKQFPKLRIAVIDSNPYHENKTIWPLVIQLFSWSSFLLSSHHSLFLSFASLLSAEHGSTV